MNKEEKKAIDILQNCIADYVIGEYCEKCGDNKICESRNEDCYFQQAIDTVINLIEKQQDKIASKNKEIKLLKDIHNKHVTIIKKQKKETEEKINKAQYVINEYETYIKYLEEKVSD